jgi:hypothetical protein
MKVMKLKSGLKLGHVVFDEYNGTLILTPLFNRLKRGNTGYSTQDNTTAHGISNCITSLAEQRQTDKCKICWK